MDAAHVIEAAIKAWNDRDKQAFLDLYSPDAELTGPGGMVLHGSAGVEQFWHLYQDSFPDNRIIARTVFSRGDEGLQEAVFEGTHTGPLVGASGSEIDPTHKHVKVPFSIVYTFRDGRVMTYHLYFDQVELLTQLGLVPGTESSS